MSEDTPVEVRRVDGVIDEIVAEGVHLEVLDVDHIHLNIHGRTFWLRANLKGRNPVIEITDELD